MRKKNKRVEGIVGCQEQQFIASINNAHCGKSNGCEHKRLSISRIACLWAHAEVPYSQKNE